MFESTSLSIKSGLGQTLSCVKLSDDGQATDQRITARITAMEIRDNTEYQVREGKVRAHAIAAHDLGAHLRRMGP